MADGTYSPKTYRQQGGDRFVVAASGSLDVESGGEIDIESGGSLKLAGTAVAATALEINRAADLSARIVNTTATGLALTLAAHSDRTVTLNRAAGQALTVPVAAGTGGRYRLFVGTTVTGTTTIKVTTTGETMHGVALIAADGGNSLVAFETGASADTITLNGTSTGGVKGDLIELEDVAANVYFVRVTGSATTTEATPFSATV